MASLTAVNHHSLRISTDLHMHYVQAEPPSGVHVRGVLLCVHGFPDTWYGWRKQIAALAAAGFRVIVPDQRGYGETHFGARARPAPADFRQELACSDMVALLDALCIPRVILLGHDWGGTLVWNMAMQYPDRIIAVAAVCTPFFPVNPTKNPWIGMQSKPGRFDYQMWFQTDSAEAELDADPYYTMKCAIRGSGAVDQDPIRSYDPELLKTPPTVKAQLAVARSAAMPVPAPAVCVCVRQWPRRTHSCRLYCLVSVYHAEVVSR